MKLAFSNSNVICLKLVPSFSFQVNKNGVCKVYVMETYSYTLFLVCLFVLKMFCVANPSVVMPTSGNPSDSVNEDIDTSVPSFVGQDQSEHTISLFPSEQYVSTRKHESSTTSTIETQTDLSSDGETASREPSVLGSPVPALPPDDTNQQSGPQAANFGPPGSFSDESAGGFSQSESCQVDTCFTKMYENVTFRESSCCADICSCYSACSSVTCCNNFVNPPLASRTSAGESCMYHSITNDAAFLKGLGVLSSYLTVDVCGLSEQGDFLECNAHDALRLENKTPVYDTVTGLTYKNTHCAYCNGLDDNRLVKWKTVIRCHNYEYISSYVGDRDIYNMLQQMEFVGHCWLDSIPPPNSESKRSQCIRLDGMRTTCVVSYEFDDADELCSVQSVDVPFLIPEKNEVPNTFCSICSSTSVGVYNTTCHMVAPFQSPTKNMFTVELDADLLQEYMNFQKNTSFEIQSTNDSNGCLPGFSFNSVLVSNV